LILSILRELSHHFLSFISGAKKGDMIYTMKPLSFFLAFFIFWMSTWMVTDIHNIPIQPAEKSLSIASIQQMTVSHSEDHHTNLIEDHSHQSHCGVCSYDHGGHIGATIVTLSYLSKSAPTKNLITLSPHYSGWTSKSSSPMLRPPIA
jgi:hypothetical protein